MILFFLKIAVILGSSYNKTILPLKYSSNRCSLTSKKKSNSTFNAHLNSLSSKSKTNHENKIAKMNNQTKRLLLIYIKKYLQKRNSSCKVKLNLARINLLRILLEPLWIIVCCYYHSPKIIKRVIGL